MTAHPRTAPTTRRRAVLGALAAGAALATAAAVVPADAATTSPAPRRMVSGWMPYWSTSSSLASVLDNASVFGDVSPFWYSARGSVGSVGVTSLVSSSTVATVVPALHAKGIKVLPTVTDGTHRLTMSTQLATSAGRAQVVNALTSLVVAHGYDGVDLDWEGFAFSDGQSSWSTTRPRWDAFVTSLAASLHARGKLLALTVPGGLGTSSDSTGYWVYDWSHIGRYADRVRIMAYDYSVGRAGPIAPLPWVTAVVKKAVTQIPSTKVQIGVAAYGRDWRTGVSGRCPNVAPSTATSADFLSRLSWALARHEFDARGAADYVSNLFVTASATIAGITRVQPAVSTWNSTNAERTFSYQVGFSGKFQAPSLSVTPVGALAGTKTVTVSPVSGIVPGAVVTGPGVAAGTKVASISGNTATLTTATTGNLTGLLTVTSSVTTAAKAAKGSTALTVASTTRIKTGGAVSGAGIATGTTVVSVSGDVVTLSKPTTAAVSGDVVVTTTFLTNAVGAVTGRTQVQVASTYGAVVGSAVAGVGIPSGTVASALSAHTVTLSKATTANVFRTLTTTPPPVASACTVSRTGWYSDAAAVNARARLVGTYHLAGIAEWTLGGEDTGQWSGLASYAKAIAPLRATASVAAPAKVVFGARATVTSTVTVGGAPKAGLTALLQWRRYGTSTWTTVASAVTSSTGVASLVSQRLGSSGTWRVYVPSTWGSTSVLSGTAGYTIVPVVTVTPATATVRRGTVLHLVATVRPAIAGQRVVVQKKVGTSWVTVASLTASSRSQVTFTAPTRTKGTTTYRFLVGATAAHTSASSSGVVVTVT